MLWHGRSEETPVTGHIMWVTLYHEYIYDIRERPFNLKRGRGFLKKYSDSQCCWKNILILVEGKKKKSDSECLSYNLMLNSGKKIRALRDKINKYSNSRVVQKKNSERNKKP